MILQPLLLCLTTASCHAFISQQHHHHHSGSSTTKETKAFIPRSGITKHDDGLFMSTTETESSSSSTKKESFEFQAEVGRVMDIIINSLYSDKDVFLRELVSNAADACDKKRFLSLTTSTSTSSSSTPNLEIKIKPDPNTNTLIISDTGVGMTKEECINNLGRIAQSGTKKFVEALGESSDEAVNLIGQFGVGFYSAYLVADRVRVVTRSMKEGGGCWMWESRAGKGFEMSEVTEEEEGDNEWFMKEGESGSKLILDLKDDCLEYLEGSKLEGLLQKYSEFVEFPISVWKETTEYKQVEDEEANKDLKEGEEKKMKTVPETKVGYQLLNTQKPIWLRPPKEVEDEEYESFYKSAFRASYDTPQAHSHFVLEGQVECKAILYVPGMLPFELSKDMFDENARNIRLYVKRVFINDSFDDLMPRWLKFVRGVVDSDDLPLNVGREILQKSKVLSIINKRLVRKSLDMFKDIMADDDESKYIMFWNNFGKYLKVGVIEDDKNRPDLLPLLRFYSSKSGDEYTSFSTYLCSRPENQPDAIYYVTGDGRENTAMSPVIEKLSSRGYEVLYMTEPLDEIMIESVKEFEGVKIVDASKEGLELDKEEGHEGEKEESKKRKEELESKFAPLKEYLEVQLAGKVERVTISDLLTDSPAALVQGAYGMSPTMQKYMKAQTVAGGAGGGGMGMGMNSKAVLEINPKHEIIRDLEGMIERGEKDEERTKNFANLVYDVASLTGGYEVADVKDFASRVMSMMINSNSGDSAPKSEQTDDDDDGDDNDDDDGDDDTEAKTVEVIE